MKTRFVVVGSGYAGTLAAIRLARRAGSGAVTLVDPELRLVERVRLHEALVHGRAVSHALDAMVAGLGITLVRGRARSIEGREIVLDDGARVPFDRCVVATGSKTRRTTPGSMEHARALEPEGIEGMRAELARARRVLVLGGGLTGVEVASEIAESMPDKRVTLVTRALTSSLSARARAHVEKVLRGLGVEVVLGAVDRIEASVAHVGEAAIAFDLAIDTLGFASEAPSFLGGERDAQGRVLADATLVSRDRADVVLAGDLAAPMGTLAGEPMIRGCQSAMPAGAHAADVAFETARGKAAEPFAFVPNGYSVSLGRREAVIDTMGMVFTGRVGAWIKETVVRYTILSLAWQARGWDYRWRPFFRRAGTALASPPVRNFVPHSRRTSSRQLDPHLNYDADRACGPTY